MKKKFLPILLSVSLVILAFTGVAMASTSDDYFNPIDDIESGKYDFTTKQIGKVEGYNISVTYTGDPINISSLIKVYDTEGNLLTRGEDYGILYKDNINAGQATAIIKEMCYCSGSKVVTFNIKPSSIKKADVGMVSVQNYTGKKVCPELNVKWKDKNLVKDIDYKTTYANNVKPGKATVKIKGIGNFSGVKQISFTIKKVSPKLTLNKQKVKLSVNESILLKSVLTGIDGSIIWNTSNKRVAKVSSSGKVTAVSPGNATITAVSKKNKKLKASCKVTVIKKKNVIYENCIEKSSNNIQWKNVVIANYSDMKKFINSYKGNSISTDSRILKKLKMYDDLYFNKYVLCINTVFLTNGIDLKIDSISEKQTGKNRYEITVNLKTKDYRDKDSLYSSNMVNHISFINIPTEKAKNCKVSYIIN